MGLASDAVTPSVRGHCVMSLKCFCFIDGASCKGGVKNYLNCKVSGQYRTVERGCIVVLCVSNAAE